LFSVPGDFKNPYSHEIMLSLDEAVESGKFCKPVQFLARFHPKYQSKAEGLSDLKNFIKNRPGTYFSKNLEQALDSPQSQTFQWTFTDKDITHLANSIYHTAMTVNTESTMMLDAAALDKPVVLIGFDGNQKLPYWSSIIRNYSREHLKAVLDTNGTRLAHNADELIEHINTYLQDPKIDAEGRALMRSKLLYKFDGNSSKRVADAVLSML
jgi:CDP-glycerol glycerophosphotransferase (TagB/SpsB family)